MLVESNKYTEGHESTNNLQPTVDSYSDLFLIVKHYYGNLSASLKVNSKSVNKYETQSSCWRTVVNYQKDIHFLS